MRRIYKSLLLTDEPDILRHKTEGELHVVPCLLPKDCSKVSICKQPDLSGFSFILEKPEEIEDSYLDMIDARLCGYPLEILHTPRCIVREICEEDVEKLYEIYKDPQITRFMEPLYENREEERAYVRDYVKWHYGLYGFGMWIVTDRQGRIIGRAGFEQKQDADLAELGFMIRADRQRQGLAYEVCSSLLLYAREHMEKKGIKSICHRDNKASAALLQKLGFSLCSGEKEDSGSCGEEYEVWMRKI